jgi:hypothetical protein
MVVVLGIKVIMVGIFDDVNAIYRKQEAKGYFNVANYILVNFMWLALLEGHYFLYNFIF